jgi:putative glutamine amidotransferase
MKKMKLHFLIFFLFIAGISVQGQTRIAVSKSSASYEAWLRNGNESVQPVNMYGLSVDSALHVLKTCWGLLLTGGEDVHPDNYGKPEKIRLCEEIDRYRDSLELALIKMAISLKMPIFGICRGEQILNVATGGTLTADIPSEADTIVKHRCPPGSTDCLHYVNIDPKTLLFQVTGIQTGVVNSHHHQAVEKTGPGMKITAVAEDGVAEAIEQEHPREGSFMMGVQWHPERLVQTPELALPLAEYFLQEAKEYGNRGAGNSIQ